MDRSRGGRICAGETLVRTDARPALRDQHRSRGVPAVSPRTPMWALLSWDGGQPTLHLQRHEVADDRRIGASCTLVCPSCALAASRQARRLIGHRRCAERPGPREGSREVGRLRSYHAHRRLSTVQHAGRPACPRREVCKPAARDRSRVAATRDHGAPVSPLVDRSLR